MQLGFVSAILADLSLDEVLTFAAEEGFGCVEVMCWPPGKADRRYAGVCHLDVTNFGESQARQVRDLAYSRGVAISGLGYYPNPLDADAAHRQMVAEHLKKVITAAKLLGLGVTLNTNSLALLPDHDLGNDHAHQVFTEVPQPGQVPWMSRPARRQMRQR